MGYLDPARGASRAGAQASAVTDAAALTSAASVAAPSKTEFDKVVVDLAALRTKVNALLAALRAAGIVAP